ncbi:MAG: hypothetical protein ACWIPH_02320 [Ostreibacterium sp.]
MDKKQSVTAENLPLSVRESLMRGQQDMAVSVLEEKYGMSEGQANRLIEDYRVVLRERKIALDIQIMNEQNVSQVERDLTIILPVKKQFVASLTFWVEQTD